MHPSQPTSFLLVDLSSADSSVAGPEDDHVGAGRVAPLVHLGGYDKLVSSWQRLASWMGEQGLTPGPVQWEVYVTEPSPDMDPADLRSELNWLLSD